MKSVRGLVLGALIAAVAMTSASAQAPTPGFNTPILGQSLTPHTVQTRIGTRHFVDGVPTAKTPRMSTITRFPARRESRLVGAAGA